MVVIGTGVPFGFTIGAVCAKSALMAALSMA